MPLYQSPNKLVNGLSVKTNAIKNVIMVSMIAKR